MNPTTPTIPSLNCVCGCTKHDGRCSCGCTIFEEDNGTDISPTPTGCAYHWAFGDEDYNGQYHYGYHYGACT